MDTSAIIVMVLAIVVGTECRSPPEHPPPVRTPRQCAIAVYQCTSALLENPFISGQTTDYRTLIINIDQICEDYQQAATCIRSNSNTCDYEELQYQVNVGLSVGDFLCSEHGKSLLRAYQESPCYDNPAAIYELALIMETCTTQVLSQAQNAGVNCEQFEAIGQCITNVVGQSCGATTGDLVRGIFNRILPIISRQHCSNSATNDALKRAFNLFKKSL
uniref:DUF19 domain-containing protein n=1 Tax=Arion vulgaris TaxID=1028688 RepID=A0A0B7BAP3_9EUPU